MNKKLKILLIVLGYVLLAVITVVYLDSLTGDPSESDMISND